MKPKNCSSRSFPAARPFGRAATSVTHVGALVVLSLLLAACSSSSVPRRSGSASYPNQAGSWSAVFAPADLANQSHYDWEASRNDHRLATQSPTYLSASNDWPQPERPSLDYARRLTLPRDASQIIYFQTESEARSSYRGYYGNWWY